MRARLATATGEMFRSLHHRNFRLFFVNQLLSQTGAFMTQITLTLWVLRITDSGIAVGLLTACQFAPLLLIGAWAGLLADRVDKRRLLLSVQAFWMAQAATLAALAFAGDPPVAVLYALALVGGVATAVDNPTRRSFVTEIVPEDHLQNAVSLNAALMTASRVAGPALAGLLIATAGYAWCFLADAISYVFVLAGLAMMETSAIRRSAVAPREKGQVRSGIRYVRNEPDIWIPLAMLIAIGTFAFNFQVVLPLAARDSFGGSDGTYTLLFSVLSFGSLIGALITARRRAATLHQVVTGAVALAISMAGMAAAPNLAIACVAAAAIGCSTMLFFGPSTALMQMRAEPTMRGRVLALQSIVFLGTTPIGGPIMGAVCELVDPRAALALGGAASLAAAAWGRAAVGRRAAALQTAAVQSQMTA